jgi:hypothetical protein
MLVNRQRSLRGRRVFFLALSGMLAAAGCGVSADDAGSVADDDGGSDAEVDATVDATTDATVDTADANRRDASHEDARADSALGADAAHDAGATDAASDADLDADPDASFDAGPDASFDAGPDASFDAGPDASFDAGPSPLDPTYVDYDVNHFLITGQSNSVANGGNPPLSKTQPFSNVMFNTGTMSMKGTQAAPNGCGGGVNTGCCDGDQGCFTYETPASLVPLVEGDRFFSYTVETPGAATGNQASYLALTDYLFGVHAGYPQKHDMLVSVDGRSGWTYWCLRKGSCSYKNAAWLRPFEQGLSEVKDAKALAAAAGKSYVVRAVATIHGESDQQSYFQGHTEFPLTGTSGVANEIKTYADALVEWQRDYEASIKAVTGQAQPVPLLVSQLSGQNATRVAVVSQYELDAHVAAPGKVLLVGPSYHFDFASDCLHFTNKGNRRLGEYFARVYARVVLGGETWEPVRPKNVSRANNVITVQFHVPRPPLVMDVKRVTNPGNFGFDFVDGSGATPAITSVQITGPDTVQVTLATTPVGPAMKLRYAQNQIPGTCIGPGTTLTGGARGNLRDSDTTPSQSNDYKDADGTPWTLWNWAVQFEAPVN